jgi:DNA-binding NtrC family response regulator
VDAEHRILRWSPAAATLTGFSAEEALGQACITAVRCHRCLQGCRLFEVGQVDGRAHLFRKDGAEVGVRKQGRVRRDAQGRITGAIEVLQVVEGGASTTRRELDDMAHALGRLWLSADEGLRITDLSPGLAQTAGLPVEVLRGRPLAELLGGELWAEGSPFRAAILRGERREGHLAGLLTADGRRLAVSLSAGRAPDGRVHVMMRPQDDATSHDRGYLEFEGMVLRSPAMLRIVRLIELLGDSEATALITGESGTGKELVARALHSRSPRAAGPFVAVNCGALPGELLESELFGHVRGAFTGAFRDRPGRFELAQGGTLFLDEVGDLPLPLQVKLLRVLEDHSYQRVGESRTRAADVRVVAATHVNLRQAVAERRFREDLYYRLCVLPIEIPPLRQRREDLDPLIRHLLTRIGRQRGRAVQLSPHAARVLLAWDWPGNVRELENALEYAVAVCEGQTIHIGDLPAEIRRLAEEEVPAPAVAPAAPAGVEPEEARRIRQALEAAHYRRDEAAQALGMSRTTLWRKMKQHGLA